MPASIVLSRVALSAPNGRPLFSDLDISFGEQCTGLIGRNGVGKSSLLAAIAGERSPASGTVVVTGRIGLLRQSVQFSAGQTVADLFGVGAALALLQRAERGEASAAELGDADWTVEPRIFASLRQVGLVIEPKTPLSSLSGGESTRVRLAALIFAEPDFLLLDEPTNNLDCEGRRSVRDLLSGWRGGAIVVSHDRALLEAVDAIVEVTSLGATRYGGNWSHYVERKEAERIATQRDLAESERKLAAFDRKTQQTVERQSRRDKAGHVKAGKGDMPRILAGARKALSEATAGRQARDAARQRVQLVERLGIARMRIEVNQPLTVELASSQSPASKVVLAVNELTAGYDGVQVIIRGLSFAMTARERLAIVGSNGSGKTTLLKVISGDLRPLRGTVEVAPDVAILDQHVSLLDPAASILVNFQRINPNLGANACRAALARFMFRADAALLPVAELSGGEVLRAGLACVLGASTSPSLLILDEPTNHLDIPSIRTIETGLNAYDGAMLIVSHDDAFLNAIGVSRRVDLTD